MNNANELRIGNYLSTKEAIGITTVFHIDTDDDGWRINYLSGKFYDPVSLTPEILEKAGFVGVKPHDKDIYHYNGLTVVLTAKKGNLTMWYIEGQEPAELNRNTDYLHQLQNLYFALTGGELPITLNQKP